MRGKAYDDQKQAAEELQRKIERRKERAKIKQEKLEEEARESYLTIEQFSYLKRKFEVTSRRLKDH